MINLTKIDWDKLLNNDKELDKVLRECKIDEEEGEIMKEFCDGEEIIKIIKEKITTV